MYVYQKKRGKKKDCRLTVLFFFSFQLHECLGSALGAMGPETFLNFLPLKLDSQDLSEANLWLFPILKQYIVGARLSFFTESVLSLVAFVKQKSKMVRILMVVQPSCYFLLSRR